MFSLSCQHTGKFAKLWKRNFSLDNLDGLVLTFLKPGILCFGCLLSPTKVLKP